MKKLLFTLLMAISGFGAFSQVQVGTGTSTTSNVPITSCYGYTYSEQIYYQAEINAAGNITSLDFYYDGGNNANSDAWTIYMGHTTKTDYTTNTDWIGAGALTQVFSGTITFPAAGNWMTITLTTPFAYNNVDNLIIGVDENAPGYDCSANWRRTSSGVNRSIYYRSDGTNPDPLAPPSATGRNLYFPNVILGGIMQSCPNPSALTAFGTSFDSTNVTWTNGVNDSIWMVQYGTSGFTIGTGTVINASNDTVSLTGLAANTDYDVYVRSICHVGDTSAWTGPISVVTPCSNFIPSYLQDFTTYVPGCWEEATGLLSASSVLTPGSSSWTSDGFANNGSSGSARMEIWSTGKDEWLISPSIDLGTGAIAYQVEFDVALTEWNTTAADTMQLDDTLALVVSTDNGATWSNANIVKTWTNGSEPSNTGDHEVYSLVGYTGVVKLGYYAASSVSGEDVNVYIDNFWVREIPTCPEPDSLNVLSFGTDSVDLTWVAGGLDSVWVVEYDTAGFALGTGNTHQAGNDTTTINGLTPNTTYDVYFRSVCHVGDSSIWMGPVSFTTDALCVVPSGISSFLTASDSTNITWISNAADSSWIVEYGSAGFILGSGTTQNLMNDTTSISGLAPSSTYHVYVRTVCKTLDTSSWVGPYTFTTPCQSFATFPFVETFDDTSSTEACWLVIDNNSDGDKWNMDYTSNTFAGTEVAMMYTDFNSGNNDDYLVSPRFTLTGNQRLRFQTRVQSSGEPNDYEIVVSSTGTNPVDFSTVVATEVISSTTYEEKMYNLNAFTGDYYIAVKIPSGGLDGWRLYVDNFTIEEIPACPDLSNISTVNAYPDSATITWVSGINDSVWMYEYGPAGFTQGTGTTVNSLTDTVTIAGLSANTAYDIYVRGICYAGDTSAWIGAYTFNTACLTFASLPFTETFDDTSSTQSCWTVIDNNSDGDTWNMDYTSNTFAGTEVAMMYTDFNSGNNDDYLISPRFTLTGNERIRFQTRAQSTFEPNDYEIVVSSTGTNPVDFSTVVATETISLTTYEEKIYNLNAFTGDYYIAVKIPSGGLDGWRLYIDDFTVEEIPTCPKGSNVVAYGAGVDSINLTWTPGIFDSTWVVEYGPEGFALGTGTTVASSTDSTTIYGLTADTEYDFYVRSVCHAGDSSIWIGPGVDTTLPLCLRPQAFAILFSDSTSINVGWNVDASQASYEVEMVPTGGAQGTGTVQTTAYPNNFLVFGGLTALTEYDFYVRSICTSGDTSVWDGPFTGKTSCSSFAVVPYSESFSSYVPECWTEAEGLLDTITTFDDTTSSDWADDGFANVGSTGAAKLNIWSTSKKDWIISPSINLGSAGNQTHLIEFDVALTDYSNASTPSNGFGPDDKLALVVSTDNGATWSDSNILVLFDTANTPSHTGDHIVYILRNHSGIVKFGFYGESTVSNEDNDAFIDNFQIRDTVLVGIDELNNLSQFRVYPNPNNGEFTLWNEGVSLNTTVTILDIQGRVMYDNNHYFSQNGRRKINLTDVTTGVYILQIKNEGRIEQHRIIID